MREINRIILASSSPRRMELLEQAGIPFDTDAPDTDETVTGSLSPSEFVEELSRRKAEAVAKRHTDDIVIGADTVVVFDGRILGKPADKEDAYAMLCTLAGKTHEVYTGVTIIFPEGKYKKEGIDTFHVKTSVKMYKSDGRLLMDYVDSGEPLDKAGAYGIQGKGALLVERIDGDYNNVKGLPLAELYRRLYDAD